MAAIFRSFPAWAVKAIHDNIAAAIAGGAKAADLGWLLAATGGGGDAT